MPYLVRLTARAQDDFANLFNEIHGEDSDAAHAWFRGLNEAVLSLREMPLRCPVTAEDDQLRQLLYGHKPHIYRVIYLILEKQKVVQVLHIRHGARHRFDALE